MLAYLLFVVMALVSPDSLMTSRVRSTHPYIRAMLAEAQVRSGTFRRLISTIERSDAIVYIEEATVVTVFEHVCCPS